MSSSIPGTVIIFGPHYTREGFGLLARTWAMALHSAGVKVRIVPVNCKDPNITGGLDDLDWPLLCSLENTPVVPPITAIFAYVPTYEWPKTPLPKPHVRIMLNTFDSTSGAALPPSRMVFICSQMDQVWVVNEAEEQAWIRAGLAPYRVRSFKWPHTWLESKQLPPAKAKARRGQPFRFLHVSLFLPRRRLDVLLRAFFEEFHEASEAELYLKMTYPSWHPKGPGKARKDLAALIQHWRKQTGSRANIIIDEELGTRLGMVRLIDSSDVYVSPDVVSTAPVGEAMIRKRPVIIGEGWGIDYPPEAWVVPNSGEQIQFTPEMANYMPHFKGTTFPCLNLGLMRKALRRFYSMTDSERQAMGESVYHYMRERYSYAATVPAAIAAIQQSWKDKSSTTIEVTATKPVPQPAPEQTSRKTFNISWCGLQLFHGRLPKANREICLELIRRGHQVSIMPGNGPFHIEELDLNQSPKFPALARCFYEPLAQPADFNVGGRLTPVFNEKPAARQVLMSNWWGSALPEDWARKFTRHTREVWVPSRFVRDNLLRAGVPEDQVQVVPLGFDPAVFRPEAPPASLKTRKRFKFLFVGEASSRKGFDLLLQAYIKTFRRHDDVCLVIKDMNCEDYYERRAGQELVREYQANPRCPEMEYLDFMLTEEEMAGLYTACDCFVQPFRTAGFGLAILEAMACGLPVLTTNHGGPMEFCDDETAWLLPAREIRRYSYFAGPWRINSELIHGLIEISDLQDRMSHIYRHPETARQCAKAAAVRVQAKFTWSHTADRVVERFNALEQSPSARQRPDECHPICVQPVLPPVAKYKPDAPSLMVFAPFYNRSGYGVGARALVTGLHRLGVRVRTVPLDSAEPGIDDCDLSWLKSLEATPMAPPLAALFFHVPNPNWLKLPLPPHTKRIMFTTFDSSAQGNLPPSDWLTVCQQMDQVWLMTDKEKAVFVAAGIPETKLKVVTCPHHWTNNPLLPPIRFGAKSTGKPFRFLSIAMFQPRRRWDTLIEAYLTEFKDRNDVELYLKVNYPSWHPVPDQPQKDLHALVANLQAKTGSKARVIIDETLDTRLGICRLIDSCDAYVSTDTSSTAPVSEAFVRGRIAIIPHGYGVRLPHAKGAVTIPVNPKLSRPMTEEELRYQPYHRGRSMPLLDTDDVRRGLRTAFEMSEAQREQLGREIISMAEKSYSASAVLPEAIGFLEELLRKPGYRNASAAPAPGRTEKTNENAGRNTRLKLTWHGTFLDFGSLSLVNRELTAALSTRSDLDLSLVSPDSLGDKAAESQELQELAGKLRASSPSDVQVTVRHAWPPDWKRPANGKLVVIQPWEFGALPEQWLKDSAHVDEFWVPSDFVRREYVESGVPAVKVAVVPNGVNPEKFHPQVAPMKLATRKKFKFLFVGGTIFRKGPDLLLKAYLENFTAADDVCLVIKDFGGKSVYAGQTFEEKIRAAQAATVVQDSQAAGSGATLAPDQTGSRANAQAEKPAPLPPEILYLNDELPPDALPGLYTACDCLVLPYRGEGFGLPALEAMSCGLPVIVTAGGATDDFVRDDFAWRIPAKRMTFGNEISGMKLTSPGWLLEPDAAALGRFMRGAFSNPAESHNRGQLAAQYAKQFSWQNAAAIASQRIGDLGKTRSGIPSSNGRTPEPSKGETPNARTKITLPPCALAGHLGEARELVRQKKFRAAWDSTLRALSKRPFHPEAFLLLAEIAQSVGDGQSAKQCAEHARKIAPNWKPAKKFLNQRLKGGARPDWLNPSSILNPPSSNRLSVCLIVKDEEKFIGQCLKSVRDIASQIVVVDTGSTDRTVEIAKEHGAEVHSFAWCDDFSAAHNAALEHATGDWILALDADEELSADGREKIKAAMPNSTVMAWRLPIVDAGREAEGRSYVPRLYRNAPGLFYVGRVHEQIFSSIEVRRNEWGLENRLGEATIIHHGYTPELMRDRNKIERNLRLLERAIEELPDEPHLLMNYGLELARSGRETEALERYREAFRILSSKPAAEVVPELRETLLMQLCTRLTAAKHFDEVERVLTSPLAQKYGGLTASLHFSLGLALIELRQFSEAADQMRQCLAKRRLPCLAPINKEITTAAPHHCLALCLAKSNDATAAEAAFQEGLKEINHGDVLHLDYTRFLAEQNRPVEALHQLHEVVTANAKNIAAWRLGGQIALSRPEFLEFARDWTLEAMRYIPDDLLATSQRAEALMLSGETAAALSLWETVWNKTSQPAALAALVLCESIESPTTHVPSAGQEEADASRAFIAWYQKLISRKANKTVVGLNAQIDKLSRALPTATKILEAAIAEVNRTQAVMT